MRNCPDIATLNSRFIHGLALGLHLGISHRVGHGVGYVLELLAHVASHFQSSFRINVSKVTIGAKILKWQRFLMVIYWFLTVIHQFLTVILTRGRCRAAMAAKNTCEYQTNTWSKITTFIVPAFRAQIASHQSTSIYIYMIDQTCAHQTSL